MRVFEFGFDFCMVSTSPFRTNGSGEGSLRWEDTSLLACHLRMVLSS